MSPRSVARIVLAALVSLASASGAFAQSEAEIEAARLKGIEFIKSQQTENGHWEYDDNFESDRHNVGITALCTIALIENGVPHTDPAVRKGYQYVLANTSSLTNTYDLSLSVVLLSRMGDRRDRPKIKELAARLIAGQLKSGGWTYTCPVVDVDVLRDPRRLVLKEGVGDNSCTQFAVLGLWVASRSNVDIEYTLRGVAHRFVQNQKEDGGWDYKLDEEGRSSASMTTAGLFCLSVAQANRIRSGKTGPIGQTAQPAATSTSRTSTTTAPAAASTEETESEPKPLVEDPPVKSLIEHPVFAKGLKRTGDFVRSIGPGSAKYFLWSVERVGVLLGLEKIGDTDWFEKGASALLKSQGPDGAWVESHGPLAATSFAVLFLRRANLGSDISRLLEGESPQQFVLANRDGQPRFEKLDEALAAAQPGDTIRVDGNGPYVLKHLELNKDITLQAGFGYKPVFTFELGENRLGIKLKPDRDLHARNAINVTKGKITLEGLHFQLDPPNMRTSIPWGGINVTGGSLRVLNCMISESNRQGLAGVIFAAPGQLVVRNSVFVGGRAALEVVGNGEQEVIVQNCIFFGNSGIRVINNPETKKPANVKLALKHSAIQATEAFDFPGLVGNVEIASNRCAYKCDWLGSNFLPSTSSTTGRAYRGFKNVYDVKNWIGARGRANAKVTDAKSWNQLWGGTDKDSFARIATFLTLRQLGTYSHQAHPQDWQLELPSTAEFALQGEAIGIDSYLIGVNPGFDQYRDTFEYRAWTDGKLELEDTIAAQ